MPFINNSIIELSNPSYVPVIKDSDTYYGGSQMWFAKEHWYSKDYILHRYGCGTIATADLFLYLALQDDALLTPVTQLAFQSSGQITHHNYDAYIRSIHKQYTKTKRYIAVLGPTIARAINSYSDTYHLDYQATWKLKLTYYDMLELIEEMLQHNIPVILSIGPNTPILWGKNGISFYNRCEIDYLVNPKNEEKGSKPYYYKVVHQNISGHYVTITSIIKDDVTGKIMLGISSWGKQYYLNYEEYRDYIDVYSGTYTSSIVYVNHSSTKIYM